jgi:hypothetical protein
MDGQTNLVLNLQAQQQKTTTMTASAVGGAVCLVPQGKRPKGNRGLNHRIGTDDRHEKERFNLEQRKSWDDTKALTMATTTTMMTTATLGTGMVHQSEDTKDLVAKQLDAVRLVPQSTSGSKGTITIKTTTDAVRLVPQSPRGSKGTINTPMKKAVCLVLQSSSGSKRTLNIMHSSIRTTAKVAKEEAGGRLIPQSGGSKGEMYIKHGYHGTLTMTASAEPKQQAAVKAWITARLAENDTVNKIVAVGLVPQSLGSKGNNQSINRTTSGGQSSSSNLPTSKLHHHAWIETPHRKALRQQPFGCGEAACACRQLLTRGPGHNVSRRYPRTNHDRVRQCPLFKNGQAPPDCLFR